jgi:cytochrome c
MKICILAVWAVGLAHAGAAFAADGEALAIKHNCTVCHEAGAGQAGPAFRDVAARYAGDKEAEDYLAKKVRSGGAGAWGALPMPAAAHSVSDAEIRAIVQWILSLK